MEGGGGGLREKGLKEYSSLVLEGLPPAWFYQKGSNKSISEATKRDIFGPGVAVLKESCNHGEERSAIVKINCLPGTAIKAAFPDVKTAVVYRESSTLSIVLEDLFYTNILRKIAAEYGLRITKQRTNVFVLEGLLDLLVDFRRAFDKALLQSRASTETSSTVEAPPESVVSPSVSEAKDEAYPGSNPRSSISEAGKDSSAPSEVEVEHSAVTSRSAVTPSHSEKGSSAMSHSGVDKDSSALMGNESTAVAPSYSAAGKESSSSTPSHSGADNPAVTPSCSGAEKSSMMSAFEMGNVAHASSSVSSLNPNFPPTHFDAYVGLQPDILATLQKSPAGKIPGVHYDPEKGTVYIAKTADDNALFTCEKEYQNLVEDMRKNAPMGSVAPASSVGTSVASFDNPSVASFNNPFFPPSLYDGYSGLNPDILFFLKKSPAGNIGGVNYVPEKGEVYIDKDADKDALQKCKKEYQILEDKKIKREDFDVPIEHSEAVISEIVTNFNDRYTQCVFLFMKHARVIRVISFSTRQFDQAKRQLSERLQTILLCNVPIDEYRTLTLKKANIVLEDVDVIVNAANGALRHGGGVALAIDKASHGTVQRESNKLMKKRGKRGDLKVGTVATTGAGGDLKCKYIIHAIGPTNEHPNARDVLRSLMIEILREAEHFKARSIAIPAISTGIFNVDNNLVAHCILDGILNGYRYPQQKSSILTDIRVVIINQPTYQCFFNYLRQQKLVLPPSRKQPSSDKEEFPPPKEPTSPVGKEASPKSGGNRDSTSPPPGFPSKATATADRSLIAPSATYPGSTATPAVTISGTHTDSSATLPASSGPTNLNPFGESGESASDLDKREVTANSGGGSPVPSPTKPHEGGGKRSNTLPNPPPPPPYHGNMMHKAAAAASAVATGQPPTSGHSPPTRAYSFGSSGIIKGGGSGGEAYLSADKRIPSPTRSRARSRSSPARSPSRSRSPSGSPSPKTCHLCHEKYKEPVKIVCGHRFCKRCLVDYCKQNKEACPVCHLPLKRLQPPGGTMAKNLTKEIVLAGYENVPTFVIDYYIPGGIQTKYHPNPGRPFLGVNKRAYIPCTREGEEIAGLLRKAFEYGLTFTVGKTPSTNHSDVVIWGDIEHKTTLISGPDGFPDPTYLDRVKRQLADKGIVGHDQ